MKKATNSALMRQKNEKIILSIINKGPVSRAEIAKKTGLTKAAVTIIIDDLKQRGIVTEKNGRTDTVGRNPVMLFLNNEAFYTVGVNITRRDIAVGISDLGGNILTHDILPVGSPEVALPGIKSTLENQIKASGIDAGKIYKLSAVTPGPVDSGKGIILNPPNFREWHNFPIVDTLKMLTGFDCLLENVSSAVAIAEKYFGAAESTENFLTLQVDEGIGSGIILNDSLFRGPCELGHTSIKYDGIKCECGGTGCLEKYAAIPHILKNTGYSSWQEAVDNSDSALLEKESEYLSTAIISANNIFDFDKVVLCGDLTYKPEILSDMISENIRKNILTRKPPEVCSGKVSSKYLIAAAIAIHDFFTGIV